MVCSRMVFSETCGTANVTCRVKSGSAVSIWTAVRFKFAAPRFNANRVSPGFSSAFGNGHRQPLGRGRFGHGHADVRAGEGIGWERWSSTVSRNHGHAPAGKET